MRLTHRSQTRGGAARYTVPVPNASWRWFNLLRWCAMPWKKKFMFVYFVTVCGLAALSLCLAISWHFSPMFFFFLFFLGFACFSGFRFFCFSDDWYRTANERHEIWVTR